MKNIYPFIACICSLLPLTSPAQTFNLVDIYPGSGSSNPDRFAEYNNKLYFSATDGIHGYELWVSDGTTAGTQMLSDIWPGAGNSNPSNLTVCNGKLFFTASDSVHGAELWATDGTTGGTNMVKDIWPGNTGSIANSLSAFNNQLLFNADDSIHGDELWSSDGTTAGTVMVSDIWPGTGNSRPGYYNDGFYVYNGKAYFNATDSTHGCELWVTDGTSGGTNLVADIYPGTADSYPGYCNNIEGPIKNGFITFNNKMYFTAGDSLHGVELWQSDGTTAGTTLVADIWPGPGNGAPGFYGGFYSANGKLYFSANDSTHGYELYTSDGTAGGTLLVSDINPGLGSSMPLFYTAAVLNGKLFFGATGNGSGYQLYSSDGTTAGTHAISNIYTSSTFSPVNMVAFNNSLFLEGSDSTQGRQLYNVDAADSLIILTPPITTTTNPLGSESFLYPFNGSLAFAANYNSIGNELWFYTPVPAAIGHVQALNGIDVYPNPFTSQISLTGLQNGVEYHLTLTDIQGRELQNYQLTGTGATNNLILPATLAKGMYLLQLSNGDAAETVKMVKE